VKSENEVEILMNYETWVVVSDQPGSSLREDSPTYQVHAETPAAELLASADELAALLQSVPLP